MQMQNWKYDFFTEHSAKRRIVLENKSLESPQIGYFLGLLLFTIINKQWTPCG